MRQHALILVASLPFLLAACGDTTEKTTSGTSSSSASSSSGMGGEGGSAGGSNTGGSSTGGAGGGGMGGSGGSGMLIDPTWIENLNLPTPTQPAPGVNQYVDVAYGTDAKQKFDIVLPNSAAPTALIIQIHGGGFVGGDKGMITNQELQQTVAKGVAYASLNYRLLQDPDKEGVMKPLSDCKRALQFIRYYAAQFNLDATKVALKGGSAGAGTSLWIGMHNDMAGSADEVDKMSTRVLAVAANSTQSTYDVGKWETVVFVEFGLKLLDTVKALGMEQTLSSFYGMDSVDQLETPEILAYRKEVDMFQHMSADDPPIYVHNPLPGTAAPMSVGELYHHGAHAKAVKAQATAAGIPVIAVIEAYNVDESNGQSDFAFLLSKLK